MQIKFETTDLIDHLTSVGHKAEDVNEWFTMVCEHDGTQNHEVHRQRIITALFECADTEVEQWVEQRDDNESPVDRMNALEEQLRKQDPQAHAEYIEYIMNNACSTNDCIALLEQRIDDDPMLDPDYQLTAMGVRLMNNRSTFDLQARIKAHQALDLLMDTHNAMRSNDSELEYFTVALELSDYMKGSEDDTSWVRHAALLSGLKTGDWIVDEVTTKIRGAL